MPYVTTAQKIRADLKAAGFTNRQVSVRAHNYSQGCTTYVTIKDAAVSYSAIEAVAAEYRQNDYNRFVNVDFDDAALSYIRASVHETLDGAEKGEERKQGLWTLWQDEHEGKYFWASRPGLDRDLQAYGMDHLAAGMARTY